MAHPGKWFRGAVLAAGLVLATVVTPSYAASDTQNGATASGPTPFLVVFAEPALATYASTKAGLAAMPRIATASGRARLAVQSAAAQTYVANLRSQQM
ncbi:MAG TPA: hypothetical protein PLK42_15490, partial [Casimicrobium sp.]|nr:hypothetical protein [Casimicrobium sp.]